MKHITALIHNTVSATKDRVMQKRDWVITTAMLISAGLWSPKAKAQAVAGGGGVAGMLEGWKEAITAGVDFLILLSLLMGIGGILYGLKLIVDKSQERDDVKTSRIVVSLVGGSFLCVIWFVITVLVETSGGSATDIGKAGGV